MRFGEAQDVLVVFVDFEGVVGVAGVVEHLAGGVGTQFDVGTFEAEASPKGNLLYAEYLRVEGGVGQVLLEVLDVLDLAGLSYSVAFLLESSFGVELHDLFIVLEDAHEEKEAADDGASPALPVVAVKHRDPLLVLSQKVSHLVADIEERVEGWRLVVLPLVAHHVLQHALIDAPPADVDRDIFVLVFVGQELRNRVDVVSVQLLESGGGEGHRHDAGSDVSQIQVVPVLFVAVLRPAHDFPQEVHHHR